MSRTVSNLIYFHSNLISFNDMRKHVKIFLKKLWILFTVALKQIFFITVHLSQFLQLTLEISKYALRILHQNLLNPFCPVYFRKLYQDKN